MPDTSASVPADAPVITVRGVCPAPPKPAAAKGATVKPATATKTAPADCKTVITKAEFEKLANAVAPNVTPQVKKQLAGVLPRVIAMSDAAKKQGLDKRPEFAETLKFAKMQILTSELQRKIQEDAAKVPPADIESYYKEHADSYEQFTLERLFVPRSRQVEAELKDEDDKDKDKKPTEEEEKAKQAEEKKKAEEGEQAMAKMADSLRERAVAGEDFTKLQKEAFEAAGMKIESPTVTLPKVRRTGLPPAHAAIFDLKVGEVSQVINDSGGHYIYKVTGKDQLTIDQARQEIQSTLQNQRSKEMMDKVNGSFKVETNEAYFGPGGATAIPPGRMPNPRMAPGPMGPAARPMQPPPGASTPGTPAQTPPPAQPQASPQDTKPN
jgi:peptidyl-prolyl cis-trans isomerase C